MCDTRAYQDMGLLEDIDRVKREGERFRRELETGRSELAQIVRELKAARER
jgi:hypothetical protein